MMIRRRTCGTTVGRHRLEVYNDVDDDDDDDDDDKKTENVWNVRQ